MCLIIIRNITTTKQHEIKSVSSRIRYIFFQKESYQKIKYFCQLTAEIRAWLRERHDSNESSLKEIAKVHEPLMMQLLFSADKTDNHIKINHSFSFYFVSNSNDSIVKVLTEFL